jgi:hypothetical protein
LDAAVNQTPVTNGSVSELVNPATDVYTRVTPTDKQDMLRQGHDLVGYISFIIETKIVVLVIENIYNLLYININS